MERHATVDGYLRARGIVAGDVRLRLDAIYETASPDVRTAGQAWYAGAHDLAAELAAGTGHTLRQAAAVIAALSPQTNWQRNVVLASDLLTAHAVNPELTDEQAFAACRQLHSSVVQALAALSADDPGSVITGPKRRAFYANIVDPDGPEVTVDGHMVNAMMGISGAVGPAGRLLARGRYSWFAAIVADAALEAGMRPAHYQAVIWLAHNGGDGISGN